MWRARAGRHLLLGGHRREFRGRRPGLELLSLQHVPGAAEAQFHQLPPHLLALREGKHRQGARLATRHRGRAPQNSRRPRTPTASASGGRHLAARWSVGPSAPAAPGRSRWCGRCRDGPGPAPVLSRGPRTHTSAPSRGYPPLRRGRTPASSATPACHRLWCHNGRSNLARQSWVTRLENVTQEMGRCICITPA